MARVRSLICVNTGSSVAERSRAVRNGSITRNERSSRAQRSMEKLWHDFLREQFVRFFGVRQHNEISHPYLLDP